MRSSHRRPLRAVILAACLTLTLSVAGCSDDGDGGTSNPTASGTPSKSATAGEKTMITIKDFAYEPADLTVAPGTEITVVNEDSTPHTVTATGQKTFDTGTISGGKSATFTAPDKAGKYPYICTIHQNMKGSLTVR